MVDPGSRLAVAVLQWIVRRRRHELDQPMRYIVSSPGRMRRMQATIELLSDMTDELDDQDALDVAEKFKSEAVIIAEAVFRRQVAREDQRGGAME